MTRTAIYCRISSDSSGTGLGVQRQEFECRELADRLGLEVAALFVDNDISAFRNAIRPAWNELTAGIQAGEFSSVLAWHPDRLTRHPMQLEALVELLERTGTRVFTVGAGEYDLSTATGRMCARVVGAVARHESEQKGERIAAKNRQTAIAGKPRLSGPRPYGFERNGIDHVPAEVRAIRWAYRQLLAGKGTRYVADRLPVRESGYPWTPDQVRYMLLRPRNAGLSMYRDQVVGVANWKPVVSRDRWQALVDLIGTKKARRPYRRYLLTEFVTDYNGSPANGCRLHSGRRIYASVATEAGPGCQVWADELEALVIAAARSQRHTIDHDADMWDDLDREQRRAWIAVKIESIVLHPAARRGRRIFEPDRVSITLRPTA